MKRRQSFLVRVTLPEGVTRRQMQAYIREAVQVWCGQLQPPGADLGDGTFAEGDPLFNLNQKTVRVAINGWVETKDCL